MHKCKKHPCPKPELCKCRTVREANIPVIWLLGGTGSGKNTHGVSLAEANKFEFISSNLLLRELMDGSTKKGAEYEKLINSGKMVPDDEVVQLLERTMVTLLRNAHGYVVCFAKNLEQCELFERFIAPADLIIYLECSDETMKARTLLRAAEAGAGAAAEDSEAVAVTRIERFRSVIEPIIEKYGPRVVRVNCEGTIEEVYAQLQPLVEAAIAAKSGDKSKSRASSVRTSGTVTK